MSNINSAALYQELVNQMLLSVRSLKENTTTIARLQQQILAALIQKLMQLLEEGKIANPAPDQPEVQQFLISLAQHTLIVQRENDKTKAKLCNDLLKNIEEAAKLFGYRMYLVTSPGEDDDDPKTPQDS